MRNSALNNEKKSCPGLKRISSIRDLDAEIARRKAEEEKRSSEERSQKMDDLRARI